MDSRAVRRVCLSQKLSLPDFLSIAQPSTQVFLQSDDEFVSKIARNEAFLSGWVSSGRKVYGYTSGFGSSSANQVCGTQNGQLQRNLSLYHQCGVGDFATYDVSRLTVAARVRCLSNARSGVSIELLHSMIALINSGYTPKIPMIGSVGASGDLTPMSYIASVIQGEGQVIDASGQTFLTSDLVHKGVLRSYRLRGREALAIMNGTSFMSAIAALALSDCQRVVTSAIDLTSSLVVLLGGREESFNPDLHLEKPQSGQAAAARSITESLNKVNYRFDEEVSPGARYGIQDPYSIRCAPHIIGVALSNLQTAKEIVECEINSVTDNPIVNHDKECVLHGGHFFGGHIANVCDTLKSSIASTLNLVDRQVALLMDRRFVGVFPENLVDAQALGGDASLNHGMKAMQITLSAMAAEAAKMAMPMSVFSRSTESTNQDVVSMGTIAARDLLKIAELSLNGVAISAIIMNQASVVRESSCHDQVASILHDFGDGIESIKEDRPLDTMISTVVNTLRKIEVVVLSLVLLLGAMFLPTNLLADDGKGLISKLREEYQKIGEVRADLDVEKTSPFVKKPIKSGVRLNAKQKQMVWTTVRPIKTVTSIDEGVLTIDAKPIPDSASNEVKPLLNALQSLLLFQWGEVYNQFSLRAEENMLTAIPKSADLSKFFEKVTIEFDENLKPKVIEVKRGDELTKMAVKRIDFKVKKDE